MSKIKKVPKKSNVQKISDELKSVFNESTKSYSIEISKKI